MLYPLSSNSWNKEEAAVFQQVLEKGRFTMGDSVKEFETAFAYKFRVPNALMVSSGSMANLIALSAFFYKKERPLERGDEVIVPSISWATTYYPLQQLGLKLKFLDVELDTLNMDVSRLEEALTPKTRMVVAVSILGNPCALDILRTFCDKHELYLFEDNCESMGALLNGKLCGTFGDIGTFSTFFSHHISTMEGGIIVAKDEEIYHLAKSLRAHGWTRDIPPDSSIYNKNSNDFYEAYRFILPGYNARPLELSGALGIEQLKKLDSLLAIRKQNAKVFVDLFGQDERFIIQKENGSSSWFSFTIVLNPSYSSDRSRVIKALRENGIEFRMITGGCFLRHDVIRYFDYETVGDIINANIAHDHGFFVGNHPVDIRLQIEKLWEVLDGAVR
ncbi:MAG TPA: DegT/DnrJ/EryC1/StrS family aminotransferase [Nitrospinaceae bacterium]|jgi:CDP-6-deoxy-D-xylo-4-hexulose-3-dehydrase|nr:DegT/DnrJ/EryC1/StrS family aminotransferase [Nitrospinaceae bacterium]HIO23420.1 DegT/DnrJ/EryC1/StrS family aminotransferase [Nitrospinaceae bacterium]